MRRCIKGDRPTDHTMLYRGMSMKGTFRFGDRLIVEAVVLDDVRAGDVVVCRSPNDKRDSHPRVHRVVSVTNGGLVTRGDNSPHVDREIVTPENLIGRVSGLARKGKMRRVRGGKTGLLIARVFHLRHRLWNCIKIPGRPLYGCLRGSGIVPMLWRPSLRRVHLMTEDGEVIKYLHGDRTVARRWPQRGRFECRKPYDLILHNKD